MQVFFCDGVKKPALGGLLGYRLLQSATLSVESYDAHRSLPLGFVGLRVSQVAPTGARSFVFASVPFVSV